MVQVNDEGLAEQLRNSTDQLAQVRRELEIERNSNQLLKNKVDDLRLQELAEAEDGVVVDTSKVELEVELVQLEKERDLLRTQLDQCKRSGQLQIDEIAALNASLSDQQEDSRILSSELSLAKAEQARFEAKLEQLQSGAAAPVEGVRAADATARIAELEG